MKKLLALLVLTMALSSVMSIAQAEIKTVATLSASGGTNVTTNIAAQAGRSIYIYSIEATSDKAGSIITVRKGATTGVTTNYTTVGTIAVGASSINRYNSGYPILAFPVGTLANFILDSTTANNLIISYDIK